MAEILVLGAGLNGLATAMLLAGDGHRVTILEAGREAGGVARRIDAGGAHVDLGPTILADLEPRMKFHHFLRVGDKLLILGEPDERLPQRR